MATIKYIKVNDEVFEIDTRIIPVNSMLYYMLSDDARVPVEKKEIKQGNNHITIPCISGDEYINFKYLIDYLNTGKVNTNVEDLLSLIDYFGILSIKTTDYPVEFMIIKLEEEWDRLNRYNPYFDKYFSDPYFNLIKLSETDIELLRNKLLKLKLRMSCTIPKYYEYLEIKYMLQILKDAHKLISEVRKKYGSSVIYASINNKPNVYRYQLISKDLYPEYYINNNDDNSSNDYFSTELKERMAKLGYIDINLTRELDDFKMQISYMTEDIKDNLLKSIEIIESFKDRIKRHLVRRFFDTFVIDDKFISKLWDGHIVVAGGSIISILLSNTINDIDCFFVGLSIDKVIKKIEILLSYAKPEIKIIQTAHAITVGCTQFILRSYKSVSEVIHGFDLDASCVAYDGTNVWTTKRGKHALDNMVNVVDFDRMSPSYEYRLVKYMKEKFFGTYIPEFSTNRVNINKAISLNPYYAKKLTGLDYIIYYALHTYQPRTISDYNKANTYYNMDWINRTSNKKKNKLSDNEKDNVKHIVFNSIISINASDIISIPSNIYKSIKFSIPQNIEIKTVKPGEQYTNTFHRIVLSDISKWYQGQLYVPKKH